MNVENIKRDDWLLAGIALLLIIDLLALPWFDISFGPVSMTSTATGAPDGWLGVLAVIAVIALIADLAIERLSPQTQLPAVGGSRAATRLALAALTALFVVLKFLFHIHFSLFGWGFYVDVILTAALVYFAWQATSGAPVGFSSRTRPAAPGGPPPPPPPPAGSAGTTGTGAGTGGAGGTAPGRPPEPPAGGGGSTPPPGS